MNIFYSVMTILVGLGVSLYGFNVLRQGMETSLGNGFKRMVGRVSKKKFLSYGLSASVTGAWQSTTLTLSMITGFLNVGSITLTQGITLMLGVGFGSSLAIVLLVFQSFDLMRILAVLSLVGAFILMFSKTRRVRKVGISIMGFGLLFAGVFVLSDGVSYFVNSEHIYNFLSTITNPFVLFVAGALISILTNSMYSTLTIITALVGASSGGPLDIMSGVYMLMGATAFGGVMPLFFCLPNSSRESKAMLFGYSVFKIFACIIFGLLLLIPWAVPLYDFLGHQTSVYLVLLYVGLSLIGSLLLLPVAKYVGKFLLVLVPKQKKSGSVYDHFIADENALKVFDVALPWLLNNCSRIVELETKVMSKTIDRFSEKLFVDKGLSSEVKGLEKVIRLTNNTAIRLSASLSETQLAKLNVVINILSDANHYLERIKKVIVFGQEHKQKPNRLTKEQHENLQKLWQKISSVNLMLCEMIENTTKNNMVVDNAVLVKILAQSKKNETLNTNIRKNVFVQGQKPGGDFALYFDILLAFENINTDIFNIAIKTSILSN